MQKKGWVCKMIKIDYTYSSVKDSSISKYKKKISQIIDNFRSKNCLGNDFLGWYNLPKMIDEGLVKRIMDDAAEIKQNNQVFVVCGIGGSYLGARAVIEAIKGSKTNGVEIIYLGNTLDEKYTKEVMEYLENKDFCVNVISKSGTTLETAIAFRLLKDLLEKKYGLDAKKRIYITTDEKKGCLRELTNIQGYKSYVIPEDVGGRYSVFTPVGLLPLAVAGIKIKEFLLGAKEALKDFENTQFEDNQAIQYAAYRYLQYKKNKKNVELFVSYKPHLNMIAEWWKQLFGESEGKKFKGLFPASANFSTDLHSLGQFVQQGSKILFITQIKTLEKGMLKMTENKDDFDNLNYLTAMTIEEINKKAQEGTNKSHFNLGKIDNFTIVVDEINELTIGYLLFFFMCSCMISAYLLGVNPFDQPGVEFYKKEMKLLLKKE